MVALNKQQFLEREVWDRRCRSRVLATVEVPRSASSPPLVATYPYLSLGIRVRPMACYHLQHIGGGGSGGWERWEKEAGARKVLSPIWPLASYGPIT